MRLEKGIISSSQLVYLIFGLISGSILTVNYAFVITKQNTWIVIITGFVVTAVFTTVYLGLMKPFPGKNLVEINNIVYGSILGRVISCVYIAVYFMIVPYNLRFVADFMVESLFPKTPIVVFALIFVLLGMWAVREGLEVIARVSPIISVVTILVVFILIILIIKDMKITNLLPLYNLTFKKLVQGTHIIFAIPFGEIQIFLFIAPYVKEQKKVKKAMFLGLLFGMIIVLIIIIRNIAVLGVLLDNQVSATYQVATLINVGEIITKVEVLVGMVLLFTLFLKVCIFYYAIVLGVATILKMRTYKPIIIPYGIISLTLSVSLYDASLDGGYFGANIYPISAIPVQVILPVLTLIIIWLRRFPKEKS